MWSALECHWQVGAVAHLLVQGVYPRQSSRIDLTLLWTVKVSQKKTQLARGWKSPLRQQWRVVHEEQGVNKSSFMNQAAEKKFATR